MDNPDAELKKIFVQSLLADMGLIWVKVPHSELKYKIILKNPEPKQKQII